MGHYHLVHCIPHPRMHGLNGYKEVIETVTWGFEQLGHRVTYAINDVATETTNIIFGAQVMSLAALKQLPDNTIIYNFEQLRGYTPNQLKEQIKYCAQDKRFKLWEYSQINVPSWQTLGRHEMKVVPIGYAPVLTRIPRAANQDIDVLIYGMSGERRLQAFHALSQTGLTTVFVSGIYGAARDDLISRCKIVLNINLWKSRIFEVVRVSYLLANKKAVVADLDADTGVEEDLRGAVRFASSLQELVTICHSLIDNEAERIKAEEAGFASMRRRDITTILRSALLIEKPAGYSRT